MPLRLYKFNKRKKREKSKRLRKSGLKIQRGESRMRTKKIKTNYPRTAVKLKKILESAY
jgi:hypothetical protein